MSLTRLDNLYSSKTGKYLYVSPDDFNATDELDNRGNSPLRPFKNIQRAFIEVARYSYLPGKGNDRFDQFSIMLMPGNHYIDNRPGSVNIENPIKRYYDASNLIEANYQEIVDRAYGQIAIEYDESTWGNNWLPPGEAVTTDKSRYFDSYRLIQKNRADIINTAYVTVSDNPPSPAPANLETTCKRDIGYFIDAVSLDVLLGGGNTYTVKFLRNYFNSTGDDWIDASLEGEVNQSNAAFETARNQMKKAVTNQLTYIDTSITADSATGSNISVNSCSNVRTFIENLTTIVTTTLTIGNLSGIVEESAPPLGDGEAICKRDIGYIVDAVTSDLKSGGNSNSVQAARSYFGSNNLPLTNGLIGEVTQATFAFNAARDMMKKAVTNQLYSKDLTLQIGPSEYGGTGSIQPLSPSGNANSCVDVQNTIATLIAIVTTALTKTTANDVVSYFNQITVTGDVPIFNYNKALEEWTDNSILDLSNPNNVLYKFNASTGGAIVPRGCSLIGYDLRRTVVRPLYVPDPADYTQPRTSIFNLTGGCYLWQFTIKDGDLSANSPLYDEVARVGKVYYQYNNSVQKAIPEYSHHKICIMEYADTEELDEYYNKVGRAFSRFQPEIDDGEFETLVQENRIVGPLSDTRRIESIKLIEVSGKIRAIVTTKIDHGYFIDQYIAILNTGLSDTLNGTFKVTALDAQNPRVFEYEVASTINALGNPALINNTTYSITNGLNSNAVSQAEIDSVESASPYVFNCSIRSTWGICGMWADGSKATGFKSMVVAQYTGVSLQKDDRAFIRYDEFTNTWNQAPLTDAFATIPYHTKGDSYWKDDWRNFHIRASDDSFVQCVSVFAVGFHDHFLMESGGDMSITNSNSNFGNTSLHAKGFKGFAFNQDKGGYITDIIPPKVIKETNQTKIQYYTLNIPASRGESNHTKLYVGIDTANDPNNKPAASVSGYRLGAKKQDKIYVKLDIGTCYSTLSPTGFTVYKASVSTLDPGGLNSQYKRATLFTIDTGNGNTDPHQFETGTPVRLVPRAKSGTNPNKKLIRLPKGFEPNQVYYVIAPGRTTQPYDFSGITSFNGSAQTKLLLAATKENATAGIYKYSSETDAIDANVEIEVHQYILDGVYDLHKYTCNFVGGASQIVTTDINHIFDVPNASITPHTVFFSVASDIQGSTLPSITGTGVISTNRFYYVKYVAPNQFTIHNTHSDAISGNALTFNGGGNFYVYANKRLSPIKFDPSYRDATNTTGLWYLQVTDESSGGSPRSDSILTRFHDVTAYGPSANKIRTLDTWFNRINDNRSEGDRVYRLRYVIPKYLETVRDPLNGFTIKLRTDEKRRLVPQRFVLAPIGNAPVMAQIENPIQPAERLGYISSVLNQTYGVTSNYDPYLNPAIITSSQTNSGISFSIQSARIVSNKLELTVFDHNINLDGIRGENFVAVKISAPSGGNGTFVSNKDLSNSSNAITWAGAINGTGNIQGYFIDGSDYYLLLKNVSTDGIKYNSSITTTFTQGSVSATLLTKPNSIGDSLGRDKSNRKDFLYRIDGANVYTVVPGDTITIGANSYRITNVSDVGDIEDTFYIFDIEQIQRRITGQQDGIYYLTCIKGNISPYPTGTGVGTNFKDYKFSQPISQLYPINYKNDPLWFKQIKSSYNDVPNTISVADNYIHGLVFTNDSKRSETKEVAYELVTQPALNRNTFIKSEDLVTATINPSSGSTIIEAQVGDATSGAENRRIPISGNSYYPTEKRLYVELRRPSIARSGNHTFEYLGFGPGNYSTGFPLRQEVVLSDAQDFYAQSKKENGGIVFYTGLNSNGDLYIGNKKINAITGVETYLEQAQLVESTDDDKGSLGGIVTTFPDPVTFNDRITVEGNATFNNPVEINVEPSEGVPLRVYSAVTSDDDQSLSRTNYPNNQDGDITLGKNRINAAIFSISARQQSQVNGQPYTFRTHFIATQGPTNISPDQTGKFSANQIIQYSNFYRPVPGDVLLKGKEVSLSGPLGWIYANYYSEIADDDIQNIRSDGIYVTVNFRTGITNSNKLISPGSQIRISQFNPHSPLNGTWTVLTNDYNSNLGFFRISIPTVPASGQVYNWLSAYKMEVSRSSWKEVGIIGSESIRTSTEIFGHYKVGINTLARATDDGYKTAFIENATAPRANLDVVGNVIISGKTTNVTISGGVQEKITTNLDNALVVGGNSASLDDISIFRVSSTLPVDSDPNTLGRVSINASIVDLQEPLAFSGKSNLFVRGKSFFLGPLKVTDDLTVFNKIDSPSTSVTLFETPKTLILSQNATAIRLANITTTAQTFDIGNKAVTQSIVSGEAAVTTYLKIHENSENSTVKIGTVPNNNVAYISSFIVGGAFANSNSLFNIKNRLLRVDGDIEIGTGFSSGTTSKITSFTRYFEFLSNSSSPSFVTIARGASSLSLGADAGETIINNSLKVRGSERIEGSIILNGGLGVGALNVRRGQFNTEVSSHLAGNPDNLNVDVYRTFSIGNSVDTSGNGNWQTNDMYLPLDIVPIVSDITQGSYILIDRSSTNASQSEIVRVIELTNLFNKNDPLGVRVKVERGAEGTTARIHPDKTSIKRLDKSDNVSYLAYPMGSNTAGALSILRTAEFGGSLNPGDYIRIGNTEIVKVESIDQTLSEIQSLIVNDGGGNSAATLFSVESTTGNTLIKGKTDIYKSIKLIGSTVENSKSFKITDGSITTSEQLSNTVTGGSFTSAQITDGTTYTTGLTTNPQLSWSFGTLPTGYTIASYTICIENLSVSGSSGTPNILWQITEIPNTVTSFNANSTTIPLGSVIQRNYIGSPGTAGVDAIGYTSPQPPSTFVHNYRLSISAVLLGSGNTKTNSILTKIIDFKYGSGTEVPAGGSNFVANSIVIANSYNTDTSITTFSIDSATGKTNIYGNLNVGKNSTYNKLTVNSEFGHVTMNGGDLTIKDSSGTANRLYLQNGTGNLTVYGNFVSTATTGTNRFNSELMVNGGNIKINRGVPWVSAGAVATGSYIRTDENTYKVILGGNLGITAPTRTTDDLFDNGTARLQYYNHYSINSTGSIDFAGIEGYYTASGGRRWDYINIIAGDGGTLRSNVNYFVNPISTLYLKLPTNPVNGDMIRFVDLGGNLKYDVKLIIRASTGISIQADASNTLAPTAINLLQHNGGELIINTPNAALGLIYAGLDWENQVVVPNEKTGWWLMEI